MKIVITLVLDILFGAGCLWAGMKLTGVKGYFSQIVIISLISSLFGVIPGLGPILGSIAMFVLITKWTNANFFPDAVLMVLVARGVAIFCSLGITSFLHN